MIKVVIFDLDGTLLFTLDSIAKSANHILADYGQAPIAPDVYRRFVGDGIYELLERAFAYTGGSVQVTDAMIAQFRAYFKDDRAYHLRAYSGIKELLAFLKQQHIMIACNTNKPDENAKLILREQFGDTFECIIGQLDGVEKKPHPAGALEIMKALGAAPQEVLYVGDSDVDMLTARSCGCRSVGAAWGYRGKEELKASGAEYIAETPLDIIAIIQEAE